MGWNLVRSDAFEIADSPAEIVLRGTGGGHGAGMCQTGAAHMGEQGRDYREILAFYYPGTSLSRTAQGIAWTTLSGERVKLTTARPDRDGPVLRRADALAREVEQRTGLHFRTQPAVRIYPDVAAFRDGAGEPGWVAASTRGGVIRVQPGAGGEVLRHELFHELIGQNAAAGLPVWFREGIALYLENPAQTASELSRLEIAHAQTREQMAAAYGAARARVRKLIDTHGERTVFGWISSGLPVGPTAPASPRR